MACDLLNADGLPRAFFEDYKTVKMVREYRTHLQDAYNDIYQLTRGSCGPDTLLFRCYSHHLHSVALRHLGDYWVHLSKETWGTHFFEKVDLASRSKPGILRLPEELEREQNKVLHKTRIIMRNLMKAGQKVIDMSERADDYVEESDPVNYPAVLEFMQNLWKSGAVSLWGTFEDGEVEVREIPSLSKQDPYDNVPTMEAELQEETLKRRSEESDEGESPGGKRQKMDEEDEQQ